MSFKDDAKKYISSEIPEAPIFDDENSENVVIKMQKDFMIMCVSLEEKGLSNVDNMTVMKYFAALDKARQDHNKVKEHEPRPRN